jgi:diguanylate cyclase
MGLNEREIWQVKLAGMLHDIGKIGVNELILDSKGRLTEQERKEVKKHAETGYQILKSSYEFSDAAEFVLEHHERWDGKGYPRGLRGKEISVQARIIAVADTYDDIVSERAYKPKLHKEDAIKELERCAGTQFDPEVVNVFLEKVIGEKRQS